MEDIEDKQLEDLAKTAKVKKAKNVFKPKTEVKTPKKIKFSQSEQFIQAFNIQDGKKKVPVKAIYEAYEIWAEKPIKKVIFCKQFSSLFQQYRRSSYRYYLLNKAAWEIQYDAKIKTQKKDTETGS